MAAQGIKGLRTLIEQLRNPPKVIPEVGRATLLLLARQWEALDADIRALERQIERAARADEAACRLMEVPSVGPITASAAVAKVPNARVFKTARDFVAWVGLTPRGRGTGGKHRSGGISKQGDRTLRSLLINGSSSYLRQQIARGVKDPWLRDMLARRPYKVVMVSLSAKNARIIWALLAKGERYRERAPLPSAS